MGFSLKSLAPIAGGLLGAATGIPGGAAIGSSLAGGLFGGGTNVSGMYNTAAGQYGQNAQLAAFRPVGITTSFGKSNFEIDPTTGQLKSAGYTLAPELQGLQTSLLGGYGTALQQAQNINLAPLSGAAQSMFGLGQQLLPTSIDRTASPEAQALAERYQQAAMGLAPTSYTTSASPEAMNYANQLRGVAGQVMPTSYDTTAAAQQYMQQQQGLLAPQREQALSNVRNQLFQTGRSGLATGGTTAGGLQATNPEMAAYYNSIAQQDASLAANAQQQARANLQQDIALGTSLGGQALTSQQQAEATARQNMLQNLGLSLGFGTTGLGTATSAEDLARQRFAQDLGLGTGLFGTGATALGQVPALQSAYYSPLQTQLGLGQSIESLGQQPLDISAQLAGRTATAGSNVASILNQGANIGLQGAKSQADIDAARQSTLNSSIGNIFSGSTTTPVSNWFNNILGVGQGFVNM